MIGIGEQMIMIFLSWYIEEIMKANLCSKGLGIFKSGVTLPCKWAIAVRREYSEDDDLAPKALTKIHSQANTMNLLVFNSIYQDPYF